MFITSIKRIFKSGFFNFWRDGFVSFATVLMMMTALSIVCGIFVMSAVFGQIMDVLRDKVDINVYTKVNAEESEVMALKLEIEKLPETELVSYSSPEEELEKFKKNHESDQKTLQSLSELGLNPFPAVLKIKAKEPSQYVGISDFLDKKSEDQNSIVEKVNYFQNKQAIERLSIMLSSAKKIGFYSLIVMIGLALLISFNTIRLAIYHSRDEISVMRLVGASRSYVRGPFIIVGIIYGLLGAILTLFVMYPILFEISNSIDKGFFAGFDVFRFYMENFWKIAGIIIGSGIFIGAISSYLAVMRYLRK